MIDFFENVIKNSEFAISQKVEFVRSPDGYKIEALFVPENVSVGYSFSIAFYKDGECDFLIFDNENNQLYFTEHLTLNETSLKTEVNKFLIRYQQL